MTVFLVDALIWTNNYRVLLLVYLAYFYPNAHSSSKGQLILKCPFGVIVSTKIPTTNEIF